MKPQTTTKHTYQSNGKTISKNVQHGLWIITDNETGKWYSLNCSDEHIRATHKPDSK